MNDEGMQLLNEGEVDGYASDRALASLYRSVGIRRLYDKWFTRLGEPLSPIIEAMYQFQAVGE